MSRCERSGAHREPPTKEGRVTFTEDREVARIHRSSKVVIVGRLVKINGEPHADVRQFIIKPDREIPTRVGLCVSLATLSQLHDLVGRMVEAAENTGGDQ